MLMGLMSKPIDLVDGVSLLGTMWVQWWAAGLEELNNATTQCMRKPWQPYMLSFVSEAGMSRLVLETDAINIKTALSSQIYDLSPIDMVIKDIKYLTFTEFTEIRVVFQP
jgi:hypothetical protein